MRRAGKGFSTGLASWLKSIDLDAEERDYKLKAAEKWAAAGAACAADGSDWAERLKQASESGNLVDSFAQTWLRNRIDDHPDQLREAFGQLYEAGTVEPSRRSLSELGSWDEYVSPGDRTVFASCVLLGRDPTTFAPYRPTLGEELGRPGRRDRWRDSTRALRRTAVAVRRTARAVGWRGAAAARPTGRSGPGLGSLEVVAARHLATPQAGGARALARGRTGAVRVERGAGICPTMERRGVAGARRRTSWATPRQSSPAFAAGPCPTRRTSRPG